MAILTSKSDLWPKMADFLLDLGYMFLRLFGASGHDKHAYQISSFYDNVYRGAQFSWLSRWRCRVIFLRISPRLLKTPIARRTDALANFRDFSCMRFWVIRDWKGVKIIIIIIKAASSDDRALAHQRTSKWRSVEVMLSWSDAQSKGFCHWLVV